MAARGWGTVQSRGHAHPAPPVPRSPSDRLWAWRTPVLQGPCRVGEQPVNRRDLGAQGREAQPGALAGFLEASSEDEGGSGHSHSPPLPAYPSQRASPLQGPPWPRTPQLCHGPPRAWARHPVSIVSVRPGSHPCCLHPHCPGLCAPKGWGPRGQSRPGPPGLPLEAVPARSTSRGCRLVPVCPGLGFVSGGSARLGVSSVR